MREILFCGKRIDNGEWVEGIPFFARNCCKMIVAVAVHPDFVDEGGVYYSEGYLVYPETVRQFIGRTDKNGKRIYEGDILNINGNAYVCYWDECNLEFGVSNEKESFGIAYVASRYIEVIGNIHDNPSILKEE